MTPHGVRLIGRIALIPFRSSNYAQETLPIVPITSKDSLDTRAVCVATILEQNLASLRKTEPELASRLESTRPLELQPFESKAGPISASIQIDGRRLYLASRYDPLTESRRLIQVYDPQKHACVVILGMGMGYHIAELARRTRHSGQTTIIIVFEPNLPLMRAVLETVDHREWLGSTHIILADDQMDRAGLLGRIEKFGALITQGTILLTHPPSRQIHGERLQNFGQTVAETLAYCRTHIATTLVNSARTIRNLAYNAAYYVAGANTDALHRCASGYPAVCVGAGPSLARNIHLLQDPQVRRKVVVISAQTTLKPLIQRGIEPDLVTALDYHEISRRFYEDLGELPSVTLVAEPLAHASILDSFPGPIRLTGSGFLDKLLGDLVQPRIPIPNGATVAHLSFYLAQHLGCDPIILIGQDLGFTDGLYYCPGTAIHDVWAGELGPFNTLEMMEWQRIVRHRLHLQKQTDIHGLSIYSDEQMLTYLKQFERDFAQAEQKVIDASEGGLPKQHTVRMSLAEALALVATRNIPPLPLPEQQLDPQRLAEAGERLKGRLKDTAELRQESSHARHILQQMLADQKDKARMNRLFHDMEKTQKKVQKMDTIFNLVNQLNAIGAFKRARADRAIEHSGTDDFEQQRLKIERDLDNMDFLIQACDEATDIFRGAEHRLAHHQASAPPLPMAKSA